MIFKTKLNFILIFTPMVSILTILLLLQSILLASAEELGQLDINVRYTNGDRASVHNILIKIFHHGTNDFYTELKPNPDYPYFVAMLPIDQEFRIDAYVNEMYSGTLNTDIRKKYNTIDFILPLSSGIRFHVLYNDKYTSVEGTNIQIKNHEGKILRKDFTDKEGKSLRFWTAPTIREDNYYKVEISIANQIIYTYSPLYLTPGERKDLRIITPWPKIIESPVTIQVLKKNMTPVKFTDGKYVGELYDKENKKIATSDINIYGEAHFVLIPIGNYRILIKDIHDNSGIFLVNETITLTDNFQKIQVIGHELFPSKLGIPPESIGFVQQSVSMDSNTQDEKNIPAIIKKPETKKLSCNCVAFRFDDIQDYWLNDVQIKVMEVFENKNIPITIGVIGNRLGNDQKLISYINASALNNSLEIANHGWQHEDFTKYDRTYQSSLIKKTNTIIQDLFGVTPSVFIPPFNSFNEDTTAAMLDNKITHFSSEFDFSSPPYPLEDAQLYNFPEGAVTGKLTYNKDLIMGISNKQTFTQIKQSIEKYGFAVITMHPQEFSEISKSNYLNKVNEKQIRELELLLDRIKILGLDIVPISKIDLDPDSTENLPPWVQQMSQWWSEGKISVEEYENGIKFYQENGIINI